MTALKAPDIAALAADGGPLQTSLFGTQNFAEITSPDYPGECLVCCRNPALAESRRLKREALLAATGADPLTYSGAMGAPPAAAGVRERAVHGTHGQRGGGDTEADGASEVCFWPKDQGE